MGIVRALYDGFARRDVEAVLRCIHPRCEFRPFGTNEATGRDEPYRGHDGLRAYFADVDAAWERLAVEPRDFRAAGVSVIVFGRVQGRTRDGADVDTAAAWIWKLREGLCVDGRVYPTGDPS